MKQWGNVKKDSKNASKAIQKFTQPVEKYRNQVGAFKEKTDHKAEKGQNSFSREQQIRNTLRVNTGKTSINSYILLGIISAIGLMFVVLIISLILKKEVIY